jgi:hypothetical protein
LKSAFLLIILLTISLFTPLVFAVPYESWQNYKILNFNDGFEGLQVNFNVTYGHGDNGLNFNCQEDFEDLRFFNYEDDVLLYAWNETTVNSNYCEIWLKLGTSKNVTMRYGNPNAESYWNIDAVFVDVIGDVVLALPMNEGAGNPSDYSENANAVTNNGATWVAGKFSNALSFDGDNDYLIANAIAAYQFGTNDFSLAVWVKVPDEVQDCSVASPLFRIDDTDGAPRCFYGIECYDQETDMQSRIYNSGTSKQTPNNDPSDGLWHLVILVRSGDTLYNYLDTTIKSVAGVAALVASPLLTGHLTIGSPEPHSDGFLKFTAENLMLISSALDATERTNLINNYGDVTLEAGSCLVRKWVDVMPYVVFGSEVSNLVNDAMLIAILALVVGLCGLLLIITKKR